MVSSLEQYLAEVKQIELLTPEQERDITRLASKGDAKAIKRLIEANLRLVVGIAKRYTNRGMQLNDLIEEGNLGLIHAVSKFDPTFEVRFSTYSTWWIKQCIERAIMNQARSVRIPVHIIKQFHKYLKEHAKLTQKMQQELSYQDMSNIKNWDNAKLTNFAMLDSFEMSFEQDLNEEPVGEYRDPEMTTADNELATYLREQIDHLPPLQQDIIYRRYGIDNGQECSLSVVGDQVDLTRERVRQIQVQGLKALKDACDKNKLM